VDDGALLKGITDLWVCDIDLYNMSMVSDGIASAVFGKLTKYSFDTFTHFVKLFYCFVILLLWSKSLDEMSPIPR
jgi:hypothetical protein